MLAVLGGGGSRGRPPPLCMCSTLRSAVLLETRGAGLQSGIKGFTSYAELQKS